MKNWLKDLFHLEFIPRGYLTQGAGWLGIIVAGVCLLGKAIPGMTCPVDPLQALVAGLAAIGLGRRKTAPTPTP